MLILFHLESLHYNTNSRTQISPLGCRRSKPIDFSLIFLTLILSLTSPEGFGPVRQNLFLVQCFFCTCHDFHTSKYPIRLTDNVRPKTEIFRSNLWWRDIMSGHFSSYMSHLFHVFSCLTFQKVSFMPLLSPWQQWLIMIRIVYHRLFGEW